MTFETSKNLSAIGALLIFIGPVAGLVISFSGVLSLIGIILLLIGLKGLAGYYNEDGIFNNALYSMIIAIVGAVVSVGVIVVSAFSALADLGFDWTNIEDLANIGSDVSAVFTDFDFGAIMSLVGALLIGLLILFVVFIIAMYFLRKSMNQISEKSGINLFGTAGILMLIGAVIPLIGLLLIWIGFLLATIAFFQMKSDNG